MDTKLKKSHKLKNWIIALIVLLPALILICLYPQMEKAMLDKKQQWLTEWEEQKESYEQEQKVQTEQVEAPAEVAADENAATTYYIQDDFVNYAVETSYYQYAMLLQEATGVESFTEVLDEHGWINDFYALTEATPYYARYTYENEDGEPEVFAISAAPKFSSQEGMEKLILEGTLETVSEAQMILEGYLGYLFLSYDNYGKLADIRMHVEDSVVYDSQLYERAKASIDQYENNASYYSQDGEFIHAEGVDRAMEICPKNFQAVYLLYKDNGRFVTSEWEMHQNVYYDNPYQYEPYYAAEDIYLATGAYWIAAALVLFVFLAAMILPFFKKLETGWEKLFSMPAEINLCVAMGAIALGFGMCILMSHTSVTEIESFLAQGYALELLGYQFSVSECYYMLLAVNFFGWALAFLMEYICAANLRQFFAKPVYYIKHRFLGILLIRWIHKKIKKLVNYVLDIDINEKLHSSILKIVLANGLIVTLLCCVWLAGALGAIVYSVVLYILLKKYGSKLQRQYQSILDATGQMADGDLHITLEEDLGIFAPLGQELEGVQQGFAKAVAEEAKSQNMKSELITNVSHDLKTPLTAIITYVDLLKKEDITEEERKSYIETLDLKSQRLKVLIEDLFEVSKANSGNVKMNFMDVDIVKLMKEIRVELSDKMEQSNLDFRFNLPEEKVVLSLDGQRTYRIFENLLNNAMKYAMPFTRVYVDICNKESEVEITFKNMSAQELQFDAKHLTERFVRGDSSRNSEGSGLGLAIAKSFTELQNGQFDIYVDGDLFKVIIRFFKK